MVILTILDGWGHGPIPERSAIAQADTPVMDELYKKYPNAELVTYGEEVGLPEGQMGNSEVGHLNIGAGRVVYQELARINKELREGTLAKNEVLVKALSKAKKENKSVHLIGLVSDGGVHSHIEHLKGLCDIIDNYGVKSTFIHAFMDGRDTDPKSGKSFIKDLLNHINGKNVKLSTIIGRFYAMDRDKRWERTKKAYELITKGYCDIITIDALSEIQAQYDKGITDEFMNAIKVDTGETGDLIKEGDIVINFNFRTDRPRQITEVLTQKDMPDLDMHTLPLTYVTMTEYDQTYINVEVMYTKDNLVNTIGEVLQSHGKTQLRSAETEKYPHVTFFFNGGRETPFEGEDRIMAPSPKVATYDLQPEMSAEELTTKILAHIDEKSPDFVCINFANTDMVGHTGDFKAAMIAAKTVDTCLGKILEKTLPMGYKHVIIADHGNSDYMINDDGSPNTAHTLNLVPVIVIGVGDRKVNNGKLADVAPTILELMKIPQPQEMTGQSLLS